MSVAVLDEPSHKPKHDSLFVTAFMTVVYGYAMCYQRQSGNFLCLVSLFTLAKMFIVVGGGLSRERETKTTSVILTAQRQPVLSRCLLPLGQNTLFIQFKHLLPV